MREPGDHASVIRPAPTTWPSSPSQSGRRSGARPSVTEQERGPATGQSALDHEVASMIAAMLLIAIGAITRFVVALRPCPRRFGAGKADIRRQVRESSDYACSYCEIRLKKSIEPTRDKSPLTRESRQLTSTQQWLSGDEHGKPDRNQRSG